MYPWDSQPKAAHAMWKLGPFSKKPSFSVELQSNGTAKTGPSNLLGIILDNPAPSNNLPFYETKPCFPLFSLRVLSWLSGSLTGPSFLGLGCRFGYSEIDL